MSNNPEDLVSVKDFVSVRYMVDDVEAAVGFYTKHLGFTVRMNAAPAFAGRGGQAAGRRGSVPERRC
jgi:catechol 2,3-dioxygenase-like lactoylglutathione lyase family enzyme